MRMTGAGRLVTLLIAGSFVCMLVYLTACSGNQTTTKLNPLTTQNHTTVSSTANTTNDSGTIITSTTTSEHTTQITIGSTSNTPAVISATTSKSGAIIEQNIIVDHNNWDWYNTQPQPVTNMLATQTIYFVHASVGVNILDGLQALHDLNATKYPLTQQTVDPNVLVSTKAGTIYEYPLGNPGWYAKIINFEANIKGGWHDPKINIAMYKFCYIDQTADWTIYRDSMMSLKTQYPNTRFIFCTMPLNATGNDEEVLRAKFNQNLRDWITKQNNIILLDIADIEAWNPAGEYQIFKQQGSSYEILFSGYTYDGGHLNSLGSERIAIAFYSVVGLIMKSESQSK